MKRVIFALCLLFAVTTVFAKTPAPTATPSISVMLKKVMPVVVNITARGNVPLLLSEMKKEAKEHPNSPVLPTRKFESAGSGVIFDAGNGYIVTNAHVIRNANVIFVTLSDGRMLKAKFIGADLATDLAVIQVQDKYLSAIPFSDSSKLQAGDFVAAIGNPFGLQQTVTSGVVSALNRSIGIEGPAGYEDFIQTDAPINPGNSGGALVNLKGELVGINTAIIAPTGGNVGIGFAIPSNMAKSVTQQLIQYHKVKRGVLGIMVQSLTPALADAFDMSNVKGALVTHVQTHSAAQTAGLKERDVVMTINGEQVQNAAHLRSIIGILKVGDVAEMQIRRNNRTVKISAIIESLSDAIKSQGKSKNLLQGVRLNDFFQLDTDNKEIKGVIALKVDDNSNAWLAGLRPGDVITKVNDKNINDINDIESVSNQNPEKLLLKIRRGLGTLFVVIT